jgi:luciferase family oxidoreductase group 1
VALSVLDTSPIVAGSTARTALRNTRDLVCLADRLGYRRYWVAEHHSMPGVAAAAPAVMINELVNATPRIRVGSGGVLLSNHAPIVIAEQFGTLEALHPGRIDLGIGRSSGGSETAVKVVRGGTGRAAIPFAEQLEELLAYFSPSKDRAARAVPAEGNAPPVWLLGSTEFSARLAGRLGLSYAFARHLNPDAMADAVRLYRESFRPSPAVAEPTVLVSVAVIAATSDDHAQWLAGPSKRKWLARKLGERILLPTPDEAAAYPYTDEDQAAIQAKYASVVIGGPETVSKGLRAVVVDTGAQELMVTTQVYDHADRRRSLELVAQLSH